MYTNRKTVLEKLYDTENDTDKCVIFQFKKTTNKQTNKQEEERKKEKKERCTRCTTIAKFGVLFIDWLID